MLLQTNSYIVPRDKRSEHARLLRRFRQTLIRLGCDHFEVYEQVGANWNTGETTGRFVQILRFRDRKHQIDVQTAERNDPIAQQLVQDFCELINFPYQQQQGLFAVGFYTSFLKMPPQRTARLTASADAGEADVTQAEAGVDDGATLAAEPGVAGDPEFAGEAAAPVDLSEVAEVAEHEATHVVHAEAVADAVPEPESVTGSEPESIGPDDLLDAEDAQGEDTVPEDLLEPGAGVEESPPWLHREETKPVDLDAEAPEEDEEFGDFDRLTPEEIARAEAALDAPDDEDGAAKEHDSDARPSSGRASR